MLTILLVLIFVIGYLAITVEHDIKIDKAATALITGVLCWTVIMLNADHFALQIKDIQAHGLQHGTVGFFLEQLQHHLGEISEIVFFLLGAMTVVELIDAHGGFAIITNSINTRNRRQLLWMLCFFTFFLSAILDNLTTTIVMVSLTKKLVEDRSDRWLFAGMIVIAANAGGAWSPIGDVTTTMLWIGGQITATGIMGAIFLQSVVSIIVPLIALSFMLRGQVRRPQAQTKEASDPLSTGERNSVFFIGLSCLVFVPIFKTFTNLPPYMGMMFGLGVLWVYTEIIHRKKAEDERGQLSVVAVLRKIDTPSILFFLGILIAISALQSAGLLNELAALMKDQLQDSSLIAIAIGVASAIVDNVPLVAASAGMYPIETVATNEWNSAFVSDGNFWQLLAYCSGTGGSMLIIGSAAGVAAMGLEKITFGWYLRKISVLALLGYLSGVVVHLLMN